MCLRYERHLRQLQKLRHSVQVIGKVAQAMVAIFQQPQLGLGVARHHLAPVQHFVALGNDGQLGAARRLVVHGQRPEFVDEFGGKVKVFCRVVPTGLVADVARQVAGRVYRRVEQHAGAGCLLRDPTGVVAPQRRAHHGHRGAWPSCCAGAHHRHGGTGRRRQLRTPEVHGRMLASHVLRHQLRLGRLGGGAKAVQVEKVGGGHGVEGMRAITARTARQRA